ncbi:MAG: class I SAM-dependent methyltransferase [Desulfobacteraceae bacterium]|nr:MAG: class I SAM-dependent methyltransferase [Desulfobacteraceae bacterium]
MPQEMSISGTNDFALHLLSLETVFKPGARILDIGTGKGALSEKLKHAGLTVSACDLNPDPIDVEGVEYRQCDESGTLPFSDESFDMAVAVEVVEHIDGHDLFFSEVSRILKPGGIFLFTTPNILSMKSRIKFLMTGCYYSFGTLTPFTRDPASQHISPYNLNRYAWAVSMHGMTMTRVSTDKSQRTSLLLSILFPFAWISGFLNPQKGELAYNQNSATCLLGRTLAMTACKSK